MSKRARVEEDEEEEEKKKRLVRVRDAAPLELLEVGPEMLAEIFERVLTITDQQQSQVLRIREVNKLFAVSFKETVARHIIALLEEAGRAYDAWQALTIPPERVKTMFRNLAETSRISMGRMFPGILKDRPGLGQVWLNAYSAAVGIAITTITPTECSRETRIMSWLLFLGAITIRESAADRNFKIDSLWDSAARQPARSLFYVAAAPFIPDTVLPPVDMLPIDSAVLPAILLRYYRSEWDPLDTSGLYESFTFWRQLHVEALWEETNQKYSDIANQRFPTVQDWCAYQLTIPGHYSAASIPVLRAWAALPRPREPVAKSFYEIIGPVADIAKVAGSGFGDITRWLRIFTTLHGERWTPDQHETVLSTIGPLILEYGNDDDIEQLELNEVLSTLTWADALQVVSRVPPALMATSDTVRASLFEALVFHSGRAPATNFDIWHLTFSAAPNTLVFDTAAGGEWLYNYLIRDFQFHVEDLDHVFATMPAARQVPLTLWYRVLLERIQRTIDSNKPRRGYKRDLVQVTSLFARYLLKQPLDITVVLHGVYACTKIGASWATQVLDVMLPPGQASLDAARDAIAALPDPDERVKVAEILQMLVDARNIGLPLTTAHTALPLSKLKSMAAARKHV